MDVSREYRWLVVFIGAKIQKIIEKHTNGVKKCQIYKNVVPFLQNYVFYLVEAG